MILSLMRFAGHSFRHNPVELKIDNKKTPKSSVIPFRGEVSAEGLRKCTVISGKGEFVGEDCIEQYKKLLALYEKGTKGVLSIPGLMPFYAYISSLCAVGETTPDLISYSFEFTEITGVREQRKREFHTVSEGETLFDIADIEGVSLDTLTVLNPQLRRPDELNAREKVRLC